MLFSVVTCRLEKRKQHTMGMFDVWDSDVSPPLSFQNVRRRAVTIMSDASSIGLSPDHAASNKCVQRDGNSNEETNKAEITYGESGVNLRTGNDQN
jgi:hypothetical protein